MVWFEQKKEKNMFLVFSMPSHLGVLEKGFWKSFGTRFECLFKDRAQVFGNTCSNIMTILIDMKNQNKKIISDYNLCSSSVKSLV